jgi:hypothetical protein
MTRRGKHYELLFVAVFGRELCLIIRSDVPIGSQ